MIRIAALIIALLNIITNHTMLARRRTPLYCALAFMVNTLAVVMITLFFGDKIINPVLYKYVIYLTAFSYIGYIIVVFSEPFSIKLFSDRKSVV